MNFESILRLFFGWSHVSLLYGAGIFIFIFLIQELVFFYLIRRMRSVEKGSNRSFPYSILLRILRVFLRFEIFYVFLRIVKHSPGPLFPWNLVYGVVSDIVLVSGILIPVYMILNVAVGYLNSKTGESPADVKVLISSKRRLKFTLILLAFSVVIWNTLGLLPQEFENSEAFRLGLFFTGIFISFLILVVIRKMFKTAATVLSGSNGSGQIVHIIRSMSVPIQLIAFAFIVLWFKKMTPGMSEYFGILDKIISLIFLSAVILFIYQIVETLGMRLRSYSDEETSKLDKTFVELLRMIVRILIILVGVFSAVQIITEKPLTALLAGLGIGGLAVALAAQDTLKNFFGSIMIMTDKPFKIGERVQVNNYDGTIEAIGFRSTRIRTPVGNLVIIPNDQMASSSVENITRRPHIRRLTNITVTYGTTIEKMEQALGIIKNILDQHEGMNENFPPKVFFNEYNADSLNILMIFWYFPPDYWKFMDFSERVNLRIMNEFSEAGIEFAFPTMTTVLEQPDGQSLRFTMDDPE